MPTKLEPTHHQIAEILIDERLSDMTQYLMEDYDYSLEKALDTVYNSKLIGLLENEEAELYVQSSAYCYEMLLKEKGLYPVYDIQPTAMAAESGMKASPWD